MGGEWEYGDGWAQGTEILDLTLVQMIGRRPSFAPVQFEYISYGLPG